MIDNSGRVETVDHDEIMEWVEENDGRPARLEDEVLDSDTLRIAFEEERMSEDLERVSWEEFFDIFEEEGIVFVYEQSPPDAEDERPNKQKFELIEGERGAMQENTETEMDTSIVRNNRKETGEWDNDWKNFQTAEKRNNIRNDAE